MKAIEHTPEALAQAKHWYEDTGMPVADIARFLDIGVTTFYNRLRETWKWKKRNRRLADLDAAAAANVPLEQVRAAAEPAKKTLDKVSMIDRVRSAVETEISKIEDVLRRVEGVHLRSSDAERAARTLSTLVRTLKELTALENPGSKGEGTQDGLNGETSDEFSDLEDFRRSLAERLDRLRAGGEI